MFLDFRRVSAEPVDIYGFDQNIGALHSGGKPECPSAGGRLPLLRRASRLAQRRVDKRRTVPGQAERPVDLAGVGVRAARHPEFPFAAGLAENADLQFVQRPAVRISTSPAPTRRKWLENRSARPQGRKTGGDREHSGHTCRIFRHRSGGRC